MKVSELTGPALDWAVAACEGWKVSVVEFKKSQLSSSKFAYSSVWAKGGPIIEREKISICWEGKTWVATLLNESIDVWHGHQYGPTPLIAAMRCFVASRLGDEVEVPEGL